MFVILTVLYIIFMAYSIKRADEIGCGIIVIMSLIYFAISISGKIPL